MEQGRISADDLAQKLVNSRKIMRKVDTGDFERGNINEELLKSPPEGENQEETIRDSPTRPIGPVDPNKIRQSKLPDNIKKAMIENPIPQISLNDTIDINFINKAKKLMEEDNGSNKKRNTTSPIIPQDKKQTQQSSTINESKLESMIENIIRKVLDEKLTQILTAQHMSTINENLAIKVGDSIFTGKITKVKNAK
jgi:hypothetical protein